VRRGFEGIALIMQGAVQFRLPRGRELRSAVRRAAGCAFTLIAAAAGVLADLRSPAFADAKADHRRLQDERDGTNWMAYGRTYGEQHFSPLTAISDRNVGELGLAWFMDLPRGNSVTQPLAVDGVLYFATGYSVVRAVDAARGELLWTFDPGVPAAAGRKLRRGWGIRGIAFWNGKVITGTHDGRLIAIDAKNGKAMWSRMTLAADDLSYITGAPRVFDGKVIIGQAGADIDSLRGHVTTYDAETGRELWRFHLVPGNPADGFENEAMRMASKTWTGEWWKHGGGGTVWNAITYDAETDSIILGTGNGAPWNHRVRSQGRGDNLFLASIVALDARTGRYRWHYQVNPGESWDYNAAMDMALAELRIGGRTRKVLVTAPKNGFFYVIDRTNGRLISAEPFVKVTWAKRIDARTGRPEEVPGARFPGGSTFTLWPSMFGAHSWLPMAYSPATRLAYLPAIEMAATYTDRGVDAQAWVRGSGRAPDRALVADFNVPDAGPLQGTSALLAWDPVRQRAAWRVATPGFWNGGVMATAGNLVFQGQADGRFNAYAADRGTLLWSFDAQSPVTAPPITYEAGGRQYITVLSGPGSNGAALGVYLQRAGIDIRRDARRVLTFALGGRATLPPAVSRPFRPIADPEFRPSAAVENGAARYRGHCLNCHGVDAVSGGFAPDLRESAFVLSADAFAGVVRDGMLVSRGMPRFENLSDADREALREYLRAQAARARAISTASHE